MGNRISLVAAVVAGLALTATSASAAPDGDECLAKPKGVAPAGKHWYYQTNRTIQRKCWYLGDDGEKVVAAAPRKQPVSATSVNPNKATSVQPPTADARAELVDEQQAEQPAAEQPTTHVAPPQRETSQASSGASESASPRNWTVASRWPDQSESFASTRAPAINDPAPPSRIETPAPAAAAAPVQQSSTAVDNTAAVDHTAGVDYAPFAAALILLVIIGGAIFMFVSLRRFNRRESLGHDGAMGDVRYRDEMPWTGATARRAAVGASERSRYSQEIDEVEQLLAIARQARGS
jgi:hypothetical protein